LARSKAALLSLTTDREKGFFRLLSLSSDRTVLLAEPCSEFSGAGLQTWKVCEGNAPLLSQRLQVSRHSLAKGDVFDLNVPVNVASIRPRSCNAMNAFDAVPLPHLRRAAAWRTDRPSRPLLLPV
jgi:hypothetical protein